MSYTVDDQTTLDTMITTTGAKYMTTVVDNIGKANAIFYTLNQKGYKKPWAGGTRIEIPLRMVKSTSGGWYDDYDTLNTDPANPLTKAYYPIKQIHYSVVLSRLEERKNTGEARMISLLQSLYDDAEDAMTEDITTATFGSGTAANKQPDGLLDLCAEDPDSATGGRNGDGKIGAVSSVDNAFWRNKVKGNANSAFVWIADHATPAIPTGWLAMEALYENCSKGGGAKNKREPNMGAANQIFYQSYLSGLAPARRFTSNELADAGFRNIMYNSMPITWDESTASASSSASVGCCYFLNKFYTHLVVDPETDFYNTPFVRPANQDARISQILWYGNLCVSARRKNGVIVDANITDVV